MLISFDWLKTLIDLKESPQEIADLLTFSGLEVEGLEEQEAIKGGLKGIVIGEVLTCVAHPDADRLKVAMVDIGEDEPKQIVCGAPNVEAGQKVIVATVNAMLYPKDHEPFKIKKSKIRGQVSEGMICAEDEIGVGASHDGIMVLDTNLPNGTQASEYFHLSSDTILEIGLTPNRADAASHYGVARDLKALLHREVVFPDLTSFKPGTDDFEVEVMNLKACPRYSGVVMKGVKVAASPDWLQRRLCTIGINPTNNVVDVTNFVLHELGQPLHAFDLAQVGNKIVVKTGLGGQKFTTLDDKERTLLDEDLMICNTNKPMCIAGTLGGKTSGVSELTTDIFLESAYFSPDYVRKTAQKHNIKTDASFRYERGTDPEITIKALQRAALLILKVAGGSISSKVIDIYPKPIAPFNVEVKQSYLDTIIGKSIGREKMMSILTSLDIQVLNERSEKIKSTLASFDGEYHEITYELSVPSYRVDVQRPADIAEEILRIYGYNNVELSNLNTSYFADSRNPEKHQFKDTISDVLSGMGYHEMITNSLSNSDYYQDTELLVPILNFNSEDLDVMRSKMVYSGLEVIARNVNRKYANLKLYEFGKVYAQTETGYSEKELLALYLTGVQTEESWVQASTSTDFIQLYMVVSAIFERVGWADITVVKNDIEDCVGGVSLVRNGKEVAVMGLVKPSVSEKIGVNQPVWMAQLDWVQITKKYKDSTRFEELSKFPEVRRDLSLVIDKQVTFAEIEAIARKQERTLLKRINIFDVYEGKELGEGKRSYSVSFILQDAEKTLQDNVIDKVMNKLISAYEEEVGALIRK